DRYLLVAAALGAPVHGAPAFRLRLLPTDRGEVSALLEKHKVSAERTWIAVNVSARWPTKRWPPAMFAAALDRLNEEGLGPIVLIGGPDEKPKVKAVKGLMKTDPVDVTGETTPGILPALLQSASLLLTNDSGPMHVAAAVGTPVVALFGPTSPIRTGPYGKTHRVLTSGVSCSPCFSRQCRNRIPLECLTSISVDHVLEAVRAQSARRPAQ
ncbi:MAG: glycosyltransferase family 9 protein, partial [Nitrospirae bacterium]|nr:glycosyltransferase family 9 protein [Nitrospirota bacterium]